jgi:hypothetical protein
VTGTVRGKAARERVLAVLADGDWHTAAGIQEATGLAQSTICNHLFALARPVAGRRPIVEKAPRPNPRRTEPRHGVPVKVFHYRLRRPR